MATYTIRAVAKQVKPYIGKYGEMVSYKIALDGPGSDPQEPVELSQKAETPAPAAGQSLDGTIDRSGEFGPKFKKDFAAGKTFGGGSKSPPKDEEAIKAMWAIGQAMTAAYDTAKGDLSLVEALATDLFSMVDRVKSPEKAKVDDVFGNSEPVNDDDPFAGMELVE